MYDNKEFDDYSNYDDRGIQHSKAASKMGRTNKEEYGSEKNISIPSKNNPKPKSKK